MIMTKEKPLEEILGYLSPYKKILVVGCDGCTTPPRGLREAKTYATLIEMSRKPKNKNFECKATTVGISCDNHDCATTLTPQIENVDAILSFACGVGVQTLVDVFPEIPIYPAQDTIFLGSQDRDNATMYEKCMSCGDCILGETGGICPRTRCPKGLLNGPCAGHMDEKCEVDREKDCAWVLIYKRMKDAGQLDKFREFRKPRNYQISTAPQQVVGSNSE
jgi:hypothetical protein